MKQYYKIVDGVTVFFNGILVIDDVQIINPTEEQLLEQGWQIYVPVEPDDDDDEEEDEDLTPEEELAKAKQVIIEDIDNYNESSAVNAFTLYGRTMWLDHNLRQQLRISIEAYKAVGKTTATKYFDGVDYTFTIDMWLLMLNTIEVYAAEALNVTEQHKIAVMGLETVEEVINYDYTANYPELINFDDFINNG